MRAATPKWRADGLTLAELGRAFDARLEPPTLIVIGDVVALQPAFAWFDPAALCTEAAAAAIAGAD